MSRSTGLRKYLSTNSTQGDFTTATPVLSNGIFTNFSVSSGRMVSSVSSNWQIEPMAEYRGCRFVFFGAGSANQTVNFRLWLAEAILDRAQHDHNPQLSSADSVKLSSWGAGSFTLGALAPASTLVPAGNLIADTISFTLATDATTPKGIGTIRGLAYQLGEPQVYSPGDDTVAELIVPDFGSGVAGWLMEFDLSGATSANCLFEKTA